MMILIQVCFFYSIELLLHLLDIPPVGSYEIQDAFQNLRIKGKLEKTGIMSSQSKREIFRGIFFKS